MVEDGDGRGSGATAAACARLARVLGADGVAVSTTDGRLRQVVHASGAGARAVEELQVLVGEGPTGEAVRDGLVVGEPDQERLRRRWPAFGEGATVAGIHAVSAAPLLAGVRTFGVLTAHRRTPGRRPVLVPSPSLAAVLGELATTVLEDLVAPDGTLSAVPATVADRREVDLASGMAAVQLGVPVPVALDRLRALARDQRRTLHAVAADVLARRIVLRPERRPPPG